MTGLLDAWQAWETAGGMAGGTVYLYRRYLERLAAVHQLEHLTETQLVEWMAAQDWGPATRKSARSAVRKFYAFAHPRGLVETNPAAGLGGIRQPPPCPNPTADTVFVRACQQASGEELLMLLLAASCGLRRAEIAGLHTDMISGRRIRVTGKGGRTRVVPVANDDLARMLADCPEGWLFPGRFGGPVTPDYVGRRLSRLLGPGWSAHSLRHRYASTVYGGSRDILALQRLLGHSSPETTQRYVLLDEAALWSAAAHAA